MEFGMFHEFQALPGETAAQSFANSLAQVDAAEEWGLDAMWLAELHFAPERSVFSSPMMIAATIAQRTQRMKIGTAVQVLPLCHPLRLAEEVATVDQIERWTADLRRRPLGLSPTPTRPTASTTARAASVSPRRCVILKRAFTEERFSHSGKYFTYETSGCRPNPCNSRGPRSASPRQAPTPMVEVAELGHPIFVAAAHRQHLRAGAAG